jgi:hypothetical protein
MKDETPHARSAPPIQRTTSIFAGGPVRRKSADLEPIGPPDILKRRQRWEAALDRFADFVLARTA